MNYHQRQQSTRVHVGLYRQSEATELARFDSFAQAVQHVQSRVRQPVLVRDEAMDGAGVACWWICDGHLKAFRDCVRRECVVAAKKSPFELVYDDAIGMVDHAGRVLAVGFVNVFEPEEGPPQA